MKVLVYVDGSVHSQAGAEMIHALPLPSGSEVTLLAASTTEPKLAALLDASLGRAAALWVGDDVRVKRETMAGPKAESVVASATALQPDLVVVSAQNAASDVGRLLNGMVYQVVEQAPSPVLAALAPFSGLRRILLAYDGSSHSQAAARFLARLPLPSNIEVSVLHVLMDRSTVLVVPPRWPVGARIVASRRATLHSTLDPAEVQQAQDILAGGLAILNDSGLNGEGRLARGEVAEVILHEADINRADLVVAGSRGLGSIRSWLLGSVSRRLVQNPSQSVLIVRDNLADRLPPHGAALDATNAASSG
jgi:nucleotide-binding universal stress UspA family protein